MNSLVRRLVGMLLVVVAIALTACSPAQFRTSAAQVSQIVLASISDPKTFNPVLSQEASDVFGFIHQGLMEENGLTGELDPKLAESWEVSEDNRRVTVTLRPNLKWSDGAPLTVDDVLFTYNEVYLNEAIPTDTRDILRVGEQGILPKVRKVDERRVEFSIAEPFAPFLRNLGISILPAHKLRQSIVTKNSAGQPEFFSTWGTGTNPSEIVGAGPYRLASYATSQRVVMERNPYYWDKDAAGNAKPFIQRVIVQIVESTDTAFLQFRSGSLDVSGVTPDYFSLLKREEERGNFTIYKGGPSLTQSFISFNLNRGRRNGKPLVDPIKSRWFTNLAFRQAVAYGIDRQKMLNNIFRGLGTLQNSQIPEQSPYYLSPEQGLKVYNYDLEKAKQLLRQAGFKYNEQGQLLDAEGNRVRFNLITNAGNKIREAMGAQVKQDLSKLGMQVDFTPIAFNTLVEKLATSLEWDCYLLGFSGGGVEPNNGANIWLVDGGLHTFNQGTRAGETPLEGRIVEDWEKRISDLYIKGAQELDETKRKAIYAEVQQLAQENLPFIRTVGPLAMSAVRDRVTGIKYSALGGTLWNVDELKISKD